jgi:hypothetical protein
VSISPEYAKLLADLREARLALGNASMALDLIDPREPQPGALADLVGDVQARAEMIGRRTEPERQAASVDVPRGADGLRREETQEPQTQEPGFMAVANRGQLLADLFGPGARDLEDGDPEDDQILPASALPAAADQRDARPPEPGEGLSAARGYLEGRPNDFWVPLSGRVADLEAGQ